MLGTGWLKKILGATGLSMALTALVTGGGARADDYPSKPINLVVPYGPGGATDIVARLINEKLAALLGQRVLVINKPGAFGVVALEELMKHPADGYTIMLGNVSTNLLTPLLFKDKIPFDYASSILPISEVADLPGVLAVTAKDFPPTTVPELIAYTKAHPNQVRYCSTGLGSYSQFDAELFNVRAGMTMVHIPIKGGAGDTSDSLANGDLQVCFINIASSAGMIKAGRVRALAVVAPTRVPQYPDTPTMAEAGFPGVGTIQWQAIYVRRDMPKPIVDKIFKAVVETVKSPEVMAAYQRTGYTTHYSASLEDVQAFHDKELERWKGIIKETHFDVNAQQ
jgi:tripartite-type tricarboxylate transporter receptor subunit TctC